MRSVRKREKLEKCLKAIVGYIQAFLYFLKNPRVLCGKHLVVSCLSGFGFMQHTVIAL